MPSSLRRLAFFALTLAVLPLAARAASLPDGTYVCQLYSGGMTMNLGSIEISGNSYRGPAYDGNYEGSYPLQVTDAGTINWGGPLGGFEGEGQKVVSSVLTKDGNNTALDVTIQMPSGNFTTVSCIPE